MSNMQVHAVNISREKGTAKQPQKAITVNSRGVADDAHSGLWHRQVSLLSLESINGFAKNHTLAIGPGQFAENITTRGLDLAAVALLDRLMIGKVELEVTQIGKECHGNNCAIFQSVGKCVMPKEGIFCRVIKSGGIRPGDPIIHKKRPLSLLIITLSDRAFAGEYEDKSGPRIRQLLDEHFKDKRWGTKINSVIMPDHPGLLKRKLKKAKKAGMDVIITTGGTGVGSRDITPDVAARLCDRFIPGVMEQIRLTFGAGNPQALLSRGIAGMMGKTVIYTLPGSVKAATEYMGEIFKTLEHTLLMAHDLGHH